MSSSASNNTWKVFGEKRRGSRNCMFPLIFGSLPTLTFQLIQMHCRVLVMGFRRDMSGSREAKASWEAVWPTLCWLVLNKEKQSAVRMQPECSPCPTGSTGSSCQGSWQPQPSPGNLGQHVRSSAVTEPYVSHRKHEQIFYNSEKCT